eukprot:TRINITY_DN21491_c0_g1_i1.p1 TRINITY_DN21491_c0_g1~~TRINITY_DN21491_c0_g1_i1.p1  ORF type:complete len:508 (-),score=66.44 TRINITY_DN21491_c0_g1_i1:273-1796(-)
MQHPEPTASCARSRLLNLPDQLLGAVAACLVPISLRQLHVSSAEWQAVRDFAMSAREMHDVLGKVLCEAFPTLAALRPSQAFERTCWLRLLAVLLGKDKARWQRVMLPSAKRARTAQTTPLQLAPSLSGATICAFGRGSLVIFGGRSSASGQTSNIVYRVQVFWTTTGLAQWDELHCEERPPARCYHTAVCRAGSRQDANADFEMVVFGGAGDGDLLHSDSWCFNLADKGHDHPGGKHPWNLARWRSLQQPAGSSKPLARSLHVCAFHASTGRVVLHGGLGNAGTMADTWLLDTDGTWVELLTSGAVVARAHHCGGVVRDFLLVFSGHDASLLTMHSVCSLHLSTHVWQEVTLRDSITASPRIDAAACSIQGIGLLIFGGIGIDYEFESSEPWLMPECDSECAPRRLVHPKQTAPCQRACCSVSADGLRVYMFGGFDGQQDLNDLWCLNLSPPCFDERAGISQCGSIHKPTLSHLWELRRFHSFVHQKKAGDGPGYQNCAENLVSGA